MTESGSYLSHCSKSVLIATEHLDFFLHIYSSYYKNEGTSSISKGDRYITIEMLLHTILNILPVFVSRREI
jgi:hypothetical protein